MALFNSGEAAGNCTTIRLHEAEIDRLRALNAELVARLELYDRVASEMLEVDKPTDTDWCNLREARNLARLVVDKAKTEGSQT